MTTYVYNVAASVLDGDKPHFLIFSAPATPFPDTVKIFRSAVTSAKPSFEFWHTDSHVEEQIEALRYDPVSEIAIFTYLGWKELVLSLRGAPPEVLAVFEPYQRYSLMTGTIHEPYAELRF